MRNYFFTFSFKISSAADVAFVSIRGKGLNIYYFYLMSCEVVRKFCIRSGGCLHIGELELSTQGGGMPAYYYRNISE